MPTVLIHVRKLVNKRLDQNFKLLKVRFGEGWDWREGGEDVSVEGRARSALEERRSCSLIVNLHGTVMSEVAPDWVKEEILLRRGRRNCIHQYILIR